MGEVTQRLEDLSTVKDVERLVRRFYQAAIPDPLLGPVFRKAGITWSEHIPLVCQFWASQLLGLQGYRGNLVHAHMAVRPRAPFGSDAIARWLELFEETVDELFAGPVAAHAKERGTQIAAVLGTAVQRAVASTAVQTVRADSAPTSVVGTVTRAPLRLGDHP